MTTPPGPPALLLRGGAVHAPDVPGATALLVREGRVAWIGHEADADALVDGQGAGQLDVVALDGALVAPAFVDAHVHVAETALALQGLDLSSAGCAQDVLAAVASAPGTVVLGHGWDETRWRDPRLPVGGELDLAARGRDVYLSRIDVHSALISGALARRAGAVGLPGWDGGARVEREAHHAARRAVRDVDPARRTALHLEALGHAARAGIACLHEMAAPDIGGLDDLVALLSLAGPGGRADLPLVVAAWAVDVATAEEARAWRRRLGPGLLGLGGDLNVDGSFGSRTAALHEDYADAPGARGRLYRDEQDVARHVSAVDAAGLQASFHAIGDAALAAVVEGFSLAARAAPGGLRGARHRVEHAEAPAPTDIRRMSALGLVASVQPLFDAWWAGPGGMYERRLGEVRTAATNPFAAWHAAGVPLALGSDAPVTDMDPWRAVAAAVRPHRREHGIAPDVALAAHTVGGWLAAGRPSGVLRVGAQATLALWRSAAPLVGVNPAPQGSGEAPWTPGGALLPFPDLDADPPSCEATLRAGTWLWRNPDGAAAAAAPA